MARPVDIGAIVCTMRGECAGTARSPLGTMTTEICETLLDEGAIGELREAMSGEAFAELVETFRQQIDGLAARFAAAAAAGDVRAAERAAHELAGIAGTLGAARLAARARHGMEVCRGEADDGLSALGEAMADDARATGEAFEDYIGHR